MVQSISDNIANTTISGCKFSQNVAITITGSDLGRGGAIVQHCQLLNSNCNMSILETLFLKNSAEHEGGALLWNFKKPVLGNVEFIGNRARQYGPSISAPI